MKRLTQASESAHEYYLLPTKHLKLSLKTHPAYSLQVIKANSIAVLNSGQKVLIFDLSHGLSSGTSGLIKC